MAVMYPDNIEGYNYTESEKHFYNQLKNKLSDEFRVFYSVRWFKNINGKKEDSECDFLIFNPKYGYITIEVKGGVSIDVDGDEWRILDSFTADSYRVLRRSPFKQAEESMYYFKEYYEKQFASFYNGCYGYAVAFPNYIVNEDLNISYPKFLIIDKENLNDLEERIVMIFKYWRGSRQKYLPFSCEQQNKFIKILNKRISLSAAAGALIDIRNKELEKVNRIQDSYVEFINNYNRAFIIGGAGTGKTWVGIKKALNDYKKGKRVLIIVPNKLLADYIKDEIREENIEVKYFYEVSKLQDKLYDTIIVDEAQDFNELQAEFITTLLINKEKSTLYVMYDENQKIYDVDFKDKFKISNPPFLLNENIRNTSAIHNWTIKMTGIGRWIKPNLIEGIEPEEFKFNDERSGRLKLEEILNTLILNECVSNNSITILSDVEYEDSILKDSKTLGRYTFVEEKKLQSNNDILFKMDKEFKGLESDIVIYLSHGTNNINNEYIAYTRARFYLYIISI